VGYVSYFEGGSAVDQFVAIEQYFNRTSALLELVEWCERNVTVAKWKPDQAANLP
jgi:hypothetical protein